MKIELLYFDGCPSYAKAEQFLKEVIEEEKIQSPVEMKIITGDKMPVAEKFLGSPSIRIDGVDVDPLAQKSADYGYKCRVYRTDQGLQGWPSKEMLKKAISQAVSRGQT